MTSDCGVDVVWVLTASWPEFPGASHLPPSAEDEKEKKDIRNRSHN